MIWFSADGHLSHANILEHCNRPFENVREMDETLITNWNNCVKDNDHVFYLGDFVWKKNPEPYLGQLAGKIHFIRGCHDDNFSRGAKERLESFTYGYYFCESFGYKGIRIWMSHYPCHSWRASFHGSYHLHGHSHNQYNPEFGKILDVGVDSAYEKLGEYRPFSLEEVMEYMKGRESYRE